MQAHDFQSQTSLPIIIPMIVAETDSIRTVTDSVPVHPEHKHPSFDDFKQPKKRKPSPGSTTDEPSGKPPDSDHQIDEYA